MVTLYGTGGAARPGSGPPPPASSPGGQGSATTRSSGGAGGGGGGGGGGMASKPLGFTCYLVRDEIDVRVACICSICAAGAERMGSAPFANFMLLRLRLSGCLLAHLI